MLRNCPIVNDSQSASLAAAWHSPAKFAKASRAGNDCSALRVVHQEQLHQRIVIVIQGVLEIASERIQFYKKPLFTIESLWVRLLVSNSHPGSRCFFTFAGTPATSVFGGTSSVTTEPAPVTAPLPTRTGATSIVSEPILTRSSITV